MDVTAISKELEQIDIHLREANLRERRALLSGYLEGVKAEQVNSKKALEELQASRDKELNQLKSLLEDARARLVKYETVQA